jgi:hypothetical protein
MDTNRSTAKKKNVRQNKLMPGVGKTSSGAGLFSRRLWCCVLILGSGGRDEFDEPKIALCR